MENYTEKAINLALKNGWEPEKHREVWEYNPNNRTGVHRTVRAGLTHNDIFLDPTFWKALGRGLGNKEEMICGRPHCESKLCEYAGYKNPKYMFEGLMMYYIWEGRDIDSFFEQLIK